MMRNLLSNPIFLFIGTGSFIGLNFPLGKIATDAGVSPVLWAVLLSLGVLLLIGPILVVRGEFHLPNQSLATYSLVSGIISFVIPNILLFVVIPYVGSGYSGLMFSLSPVFTLAFSLMFGLKSPNAIGLVGIAVGFLGATIVALSRQDPSHNVDLFWICVAVLIPVSLAIGNVYRSIKWPKNTSPDVLAFWSHSAAIIVYVILLFVIYGELKLPSLKEVPWAALSQIIAGGLTFLLFFRLQEKGGPNLLSQIGYVAASVGLFAGTVFLGESYPLTTWLGAGVILIGIALTVLSQTKQ